LARFQELNNNLMAVLIKLIESQDLCKLLYYTQTNPLDQPDISDTSTLLFDKIFPIPKIPDNQQTEGNLLTVIFDDIRLDNNIGFKDSIVSFNIICHINQWRIDGSIRPYAIMNKIDEILNNQRVVGLGKMIFSRSRFGTINDMFMGYRLDYKVIDFN
jgi:hypothetical protein